MNLINFIFLFFSIKGNLINVERPDFEIKENGNYVILSFKDGLHTFSKPGEPDIPWKIFKIPIEIDKDVDISFEILEIKEIETDKKVIPFPYFKKDGLEKIFIEDKEKYKSFPEKNLLNLGIGGLRGRKVLLLAYTPFIIKNGKIYLIEKAKIYLNKKDKILKGNYKRIRDYKFFENALDIKGGIPYIKQFDPHLSFFDRQFWFKIRVKEEGLYRITYNDIKSFGIEPSFYKIDEICIFSIFGERLNTKRDTIDDLNPLPYIVPFIFKDIDNDGYFTQNDTLIFYSPSPKRRIWNLNEFSYYENPFTDEIFYFLSLEKGGGIFMDTLNVKPTIWEKERDFCLSYYRHEKNLINLGKMGLRWEGEDISRRGSGLEERIFNFNLNEIKENKGKIRVELVTLGEDVNPDPIHAKYVLNNDTINYSIYQKTHYNTLRFFTSYLENLSFSNTFKIILGAPGDTADYLYFDFFDVEYKRYLRTQNEIHIYDTTKGKILYKIYTPKKGYLTLVRDYKNPKILKGWEFNNDTLKFLIENYEDHIEFYFSQNLKKPIEIIFVQSLKELRDTLNQADYIIITDNELVPSIADYLNYRKNKLYFGDSIIQNPKIKIVTTQKIYDEFGFGSPDFVSIRNFLAYTFYFWKKPPPLYVLLAGDGSYDYKNYTKNVKNYVPATEWGEVFDPDAGGEFTYDIFYVQFDPPLSDPPDMIIGRIPAKNQSELLDYFERVKVYEREDVNSTWRNRILGVADDNRNPEIPNEKIFTYEVSKFLRDLPKNIDFYPIYTAFYPFDYPSGTRPISKKKFFEEIKNGYFLVFLWGHGNPYQIFHEKIIFLPADLSLIQIDFKRPLFFFGACKPSAFDRLEISVGEGFMITPNSGIATLGPSSLIGYGNYYNVLKKIMDVLYDYKIHTIGETYILAGIPDRYILLSDPSLIFYLPSPSIDLSYQKDLIDTIAKGGKGEFVDTIEGEGKIKILLLGMPKNIKTSTYPPVVDTCTIYIRPSDIFRGYFKIKNGIYNPIFYVPRYMPSDTFGKLFVYYGGKGRGILGLIDSIYFKEFEGGIIDTSGPKINLIYMNKEIEDSTKIRKNDEIEIKLYDENGILIYGNERIKIKIGNDEFDLTELYICENDDPKKGNIKFKIPEIVKSGYNSLTVSAYDNFYNQTIKSKIVLIEEEEKIYVKCLPFPNPSKDKVYFGIETNEDGKIEIRIYTLRGRMIYERKGIYINKGFNKIEWNGKDKDNNILPNGIYIYEIKFENLNKSYKKNIKGKIAILR
jgi:hypothetical protein